MNNPLIVQRDDIDKIPPTAKDSPPWPTPATRPRQDWRVVAVLCGSALASILILWMLAGADIHRWMSFGWGGMALKWALGGAAAIILLRQIRALLIVEQPGGYRLLLWQIARADGPAVLDGIIDVQRTYAGTPFRNVAAYTLSSSGQPALPQLPGPATPLLPALGLGLVPEADWLGWTDQLPHVLCAGRTDAGKTTLAEAIIARRANAGDRLVILDPHYQAGKWLGLPAIGGGEDYAAIYAAFGELMRESAQRYQQFGAGQPTEAFQRLTVIVDEVPAIIQEAVINGKIINQRRYAAWLAFASKLGSTARKVRISVILLSQSHLIRDIYISSAMRENFSRIALGDKAAELLREEPDSKRRGMLLDLLRGRRYPAAMEYRGDWYALRNDDIPQLARLAIARPEAWQAAATPAAKSPLDSLRAVAQAHPDKRAAIVRQMARRGGYTRSQMQYASMLRMDAVCQFASEAETEISPG